MIKLPFSIISRYLCNSLFPHGFREYENHQTGPSIGGENAILSLSPFMLWHLPLFPDMYAIHYFRSFLGIRNADITGIDLNPYPANHNNCRGVRAAVLIGFTAG